MHVRSSHVLRNIAISALNIVIFYFLISWLVENVRPQLLLEHLRRIPLSAVVPTIAVNLVAMMFYALRLSVLVDRSFAVAFQIVNLGFGFNAILPFRLGELARIYYAQRFFSVAATRLFAAALIEKFCDLVALGVLVIGILLFVDNSYVGKGVAAVLFGLILAAYVSVLIFRRYSHHAEQWLAGMARMKTLIAALREHSKVHHLPRISGFTCAIWLLNIGVVYVAFTGFLPGVEIGVTDAIGLLLITALAIAIPSAPAGLGVFEAGIVAYLTQTLQVENEAALACAIVFHLVVIVPQISIMAGVLLKAKLAGGR